jgi:uncharacterized protein YbaP (TraB family)
MKKALLLYISLVATTLVFSQPPAHTLLWKISGMGLKKPSYLFGTMHVLCEDDAILSDPFKAAIAACDEVYFEINLVDINSIMNSLKYMRMNDSRKLSDLLNDSDYHKVQHYFATHGSKLPFGMLERLKPMLVSSLIEEDNMNCKTTDGMEFVIMKEARGHAKKINGFETAEFQAGLFDSIPYEKQARELVESIDSLDLNRKNTDSLVAVYKRQDLEKIDEMSRKDDPGMDEYMNLLLYDRNRKWVKALKSLLTERSLVIAVGAAHLPGDQGVISLLKKAGYKVDPLKN